MTDIERAAAGRYALTNGRYMVLLSGSGAGMSVFDRFALTRFAADRTREADGFIVYVRDVDNGAYWSVGAQPVAREAQRYAVRASADCVSIEREDAGLRTRLDVIIAPGMDAELRRITLRNLTDRARRLDVTTYAELVLNAPAADAAHPAFSKLFVQTEWDADHEALLARRRLRSPEDAPLWVVHQLVGTESAAEEVAWETDRMRFLGRGRTPARPRAMDAAARLSGTTGAVLDPVLSLRRTVELQPRSTVSIVALLGAGASREQVASIAERLGAWEALHEAFAGVAKSEEGGGDEVMVSDGDGDARLFSGGAPRFHPATRASSAIRAPAAEPLQFFNGFGGFSEDGTEYVIRLDATPEGPRWPPLPWSNVVANELAGFLTTESAAGYTWSVNSRENRLTPWANDPVSDPHGEAIYLRDHDARVFWSPTPGPAPAPAPYEARHGFGYSTWRHTSHELEQEVTAFMARHAPVKLTRLRVRNLSGRQRRLSATNYAHLVLGVLPWETAPDVVTTIDQHSGAIFATNATRQELSGYVAFAAVIPPLGVTATSATADRSTFLGPDGNVGNPAALRSAAPLDAGAGPGLDPCAAFQLSFKLAPGESTELTFLLGEAASADRAREIIAAYRDGASVATALGEVRDFWRGMLGGVQIETPSRAIDLMVNGWLAYQNLSCRMWGRSAFYQSGGAFGFRDQLQDSSALLYLSPAITRAQILLHAAHQFVEADVLH